MVKDGAQLYTMEGVAAGLIMLLTAYLVLGSTSVYTPGDTHITDMQFEQVGSDILRVMDTPLSMNDSDVDYRPSRTPLELMVNTTDATGFYQSFRNDYLCNSRAVAKEVTAGCGDIQLNASVWYLSSSSPDTLGSYLLINPDTKPYVASGPGIRVAHWVHTNWRPRNTGTADMRNEPQELLVEMVMWKA